MSAGVARAATMKPTANQTKSNAGPQCAGDYL
jgi:hypothetical protein